LFVGKNGGAGGVAGAVGATVSGSTGSSGAFGYAITGTSNIKYSVTGTITGVIT
jgi:hypothetical protein